MSEAQSVTGAVDSLECTVSVGSGETTVSLATDDGRYVLRADGPSFWRGTLRDADGRAATLDGTGAAVETERRSTDAGVELCLRWRDEPVAFDGETGTAATTVVGRLEAGSRSVSWAVDCEVAGVEATLAEFALPAVDDVVRADVEGRSPEPVVPDGWGRRLAAPFDRSADATYEAAYPGARCNMQFLSVLAGDGGFYVGAHDPSGRPKSFRVAPDPRERTVGLEITHHPEGVGEPTAAFSLPYEVVTATVAGDWYDAARRYRRWATTEARWTRAGPLVDRTDVPDWFLECRLWWLLAPRETDVAGDVDLVERLSAAFPVPTGVHWYTWHRGPFDVDYPDYFPPREGWREAVETLEADGIRVMPYVNARIADPNSDAWRRRDLERAAARAASGRVRPDHRPMRHEEYNGQRMVAMCPAVAEWRETIRDVAARIREETAASAVYLDQLGAYAPPLCFATDHDHPTGGGAYGVDGYRELLSAVRAATDADRPTFAVTTENNAEPYMDLLAGYLMWNSASDDLVPLFPAVYGDHCVTFGRQFFECDLETPAAFRSKLAQCLVFGGQLGWISHYVAEALLRDEHATARRYLRRTVDALEGVARPLATADRRRDPVVAGVPERTVEWEMYRHGRYDVALREVLAACWRVPGADELLLVATNWSETDHDCEIAFERPFDGPLECEAVSGVDEATLGRTGDSVALSLAACSTAILRIRRA